MKETIKTADSLYARYSKPYPNPLNIDEKDLLPEARACWEFIYSTRDFEKGQSLKMFSNAKEVVFAFQCYADWIRANNFIKGFEKPNGEAGVMPIIPNQSNFAKWMGVTRISVSRVIGDDTEAQTQYKQILADLLSEGAMIGAYNTATTIFTLKNLCDWADKYEDRSVNKAEDLNIEEAEKMMKQLGYERPKAKLKMGNLPPLIEDNTDG